MREPEIANWQNINSQLAKRKQPTSHSCASRLFAVCQLAVYILQVGYFRFSHQSSQVPTSTIVSTCIDYRKYLR